MRSRRSWPTRASTRPETRMGAARLVAELLAERAGLDARYTVTVGPGRGLNPGAISRTPTGELAEQIQANTGATKQAKRELTTLYREHVAELLAHAADVRRRRRGQAGRRAGSESRRRAGMACGVLGDGGARRRTPGLARCPRSRSRSAEARGSGPPTSSVSTTSPRSTWRSTTTRRIATTCAPWSSAPRSHRLREQGVGVRCRWVDDGRHLCACAAPLLTDNEPDGLDACKRCRGAVDDAAAERLPDLDVPYGTTHPANMEGFKRWADEAIRKARRRV